YTLRRSPAATCFADRAFVRRAPLLDVDAACVNALSASATSLAAFLSTQSATYSNMPKPFVRAVSNTTKASFHGEAWSFVLITRYRRTGILSSFRYERPQGCRVPSICATGNIRAEGRETSCSPEHRCTCRRRATLASF